MNTIDFEANKFTPNQWRSSSPFRWRCNKLMKINYYLENYQLTNFSKTRAIGWFHNATWYWANLSSYYSCYNSFVMPCDDDKYSQPKSGSSMPDLVVEGLKFPWKKYYYHFYRTTGGTLNDLSTMHWRDGDETTDWIGDLYIGVNSIDLLLPNLNDFAYKIYRNHYDFREAEDTIDHYELLFHTICVDDTVIVNGSYEDDSLCANSYYWDFGNGSTSNLCHPSFSFQIPGDYTCYYIITDPNGNRTDSVGSYYTAIECTDTLNDSERKRDQEILADYVFNIFPNPSSGEFSIQNNSSLVYDYYIYDMTTLALRCY